MLPSFEVHELPTDMVLAHYDSDPHLDLLVTHLSGRLPAGQVPRGGVQRFLGNGDGTFQAPVSLVLPRGRRTSGLVLADVNRDTYPDLLLCDTDEDKIVIQLGESSGIGVQTLHLEVGDTPVAIAVGDLTGDRQPDIAVSNFEDQSITILSHDTASNSIIPVATIPVSGKPAYSTIGDVTGDGIDDLSVCVLSRSSVSIFEGTPAGLPGPEVQMRATGFPFRPMVSDLDADGLRDLILVSGNLDRVNVYFGRPLGGLAGGRTYVAAELPDFKPQVVAAADFDGDGTPEIVAAGGKHTVVAFLRAGTDPVTGDPLLLHDSTVEAGGVVRNLAVADLDGDGKPDVVLAVKGGLRILHNTSSGSSLSFEPHPADPGGRLAEGQAPTDLSIADVTGDGRTDVVVTFPCEDRIAVLPGGASALSFAPAVSTPVTGGPISVTAGDFDGDGDLEVASGRSRTMAISVFDVAANGALELRAEIPMPSSLTYIRATDFDGDGRSDLLVSRNDSRITKLISRQDGSFELEDIEVGETPTALLTTDLDRDGAVDILVASRGTDFRVLRGRGDGTLFPAQIFPGTFGAVSAALADLDGDEHARRELIIGSVLTRRVTVFKNISVAR